MILILALIRLAATCDATCGSCHLPSGASWECDTCVGGLFLQPEGGLCFNYCPSRYSAGAGVCSAGTQGVVFDYVLDDISATIADMAQGLVARNGATLAYFPGFEGTDPIPSQRRGYYFTGNSYMLLPPLSGAGPIPLIGASASLLTWLKTDLATGWQTVLSHFYPSAVDEETADILRLYLRDDLAIVLNIQAMTLQGSVLSPNTWYCLTATVSFDSTTGASRLRLYRNGALDVTSSISGKYLRGDDSAITTIGMDYDLGLVASDFFRGFLWEVKMWNYEVSLSTVQNHILGANSPASAAFPLSTCGQTFYASGVSCLSCMSTCAYGCIRAIDCYYCTDPLCTNCNSFESTATCTSCKYHASLVSGLCACDSGYYFRSVSGSCEACYAACQTCTGPATTQCTSCLSNAYLSAGSCLCIPGYFYPTTTWTTCYVCVNQVATGNCYCPPGYYRATGANICSLCGAFCNSDMTGTTDGCNKCFTSSQTDHDVQESCYCTGATFLPMGGNTCQACDSSCQRCDIGGTSGCTQCYVDSVLTPSPMGECLCSGFHPVGSTSCVTCAAICLTCSGAAATDCTSCFSGSVLSASPGTCECAGSFYRAPGGCTACQQTCAQCTGGADTQCTKCMDDSYLSTGKCICSGSNYRDASDYCAPCHATCYRCSNSGLSDCTACFPDSTLTPSPTGQCLCIAGTYRPVDQSACQPCFKTCSTCVAGLQSDCTSCAADSYLSLSPVGECLCSGSTYRPPDFSLCQPCQNTCYRCGAATSTDCLSCFPDSSLIPASPGSGSCLCNGSAYHSPQTGICLPCDPTCYRCTSSTPLACTSCYSDAYLLGTVCPCSGSFYRPAPSNSCQPCYSECQTCSNGSPLDCTACYPLAYLNSIAPGRCVCNEGYAGAPNTASCVVCDESCRVCLGLGAAHCSACREGLVLVPETIGAQHGWCRVCPEGLYFNSPICAKCSANCRICISSVHCTSCLPPLYLQPDFTCSSLCPPPANCTLSSSHCFSAFLLTRLGNSLSLAFTTNLSQPLETSDFSLSFDLVEYTSQPVWVLREIESTWSYLLNVTYTRPIPSGSYATLRFKSPLRGRNCESLGTMEVYAGLVEANGTDTNTATWPIVQTAALILLITSLLGGGTTLLWLIINTFQLISYLPFSYIPMSNRTRKNLTGANVMNYLFNPFDYMGIASSAVPEYASNCDFETALFLPNVGELIITISSLCLSYLALMTCQRFGSKALSHWCIGKREEYRWNVLIRLGLESYLPLLIAAGLQTTNIQASVASWICCLFALVATVIAIILPERSRLRLQSLSKAPKSIRERWRELTEELTRFNQLPLGRFYNIFFCYRRLFYSLIQLFLWDFPVVQGVLNTAHCLWFLLYVTFLVRYPERRLHFASAFLELGSAAIFLQVQLFYLHPNKSHSGKLDYAVLGVMVAMAGVAVGVELWRAGERLWEIARSKKTRVEVERGGLRGTFFKRTVAKTHF